MLQFQYRPNPPPTPRSRNGADQEWSPYSAIVDRPVIRWPGGARVALWLCPNILHYEFMPPHNTWLDPWARMGPPDVLGFGRQEYGNRAGFWRMLEALDRRGSVCTAIVNVSALERFPDRRYVVGNGEGVVLTQGKIVYVNWIRKGPGDEWNVTERATGEVRYTVEDRDAAGR